MYSKLTILLMEYYPRSLAEMILAYYKSNSKKLFKVCEIGDYMKMLALLPKNNDFRFVLERTIKAGYPIMAHYIADNHPSCSMSKIKDAAFLSINESYWIDYLLKKGASFVDSEDIENDDDRYYTHCLEVIIKEYHEKVERLETALKEKK